MSDKHAATFLLMLLLAACSPPPEDPPPSNQGRPETRGIRATEGIGYSGNAIANKVDKALDANDQRKDNLDKEIDQQGR